MAIRIGIGLAGLPFDGPRDFWRWIELCEESGVDSFWQSDRLVSRQPQLESITDGRPGRWHVAAESSGWASRW